MIIKNKMMYDKTTGKIGCAYCKKEFGVLHSNDIGISLSVVCSCTEFCQIKINKPPKKADAVALLNENTVICRKCQTPLFTINQNSVVSFAFLAECVCGQVFSRAEKYKKVSRRLGEYAGLLEEE